MYIQLDKKEVETAMARSRRMVLYYEHIFKSGWPPRILVWAYNRMPKERSCIGNQVMDFYLKLANKKEYFALLEEFKMKKTGYEMTL